MSEYKELGNLFSEYDYIDKESNILRKEMINQVAQHNYGEDDGTIHPNLTRNIITSISGDVFPVENLYPGRLWYRTDEKKFYYWNDIEWCPFLVEATTVETRSSGQVLPESDNSYSGQIYYNSSNTTLYAFDGKDWIPVVTKNDTNLDRNLTVGAANKPIYIINGQILETSMDIGTANNPIYMKNGELIPCDLNVGSPDKLTYMEGGILVTSNATRGTNHDASLTGTYAGRDGTFTPVWMSEGTITEATATVGSDGTEPNPIWMDKGTLKNITATIGNAINPIYMDRGVIKSSTATIGNDARLVWLKNGNITPSSTTVGSKINPIYLNAGTLTASVETVGDIHTGVYLKNGIITKCEPITRTYKDVTLLARKSQTALTTVEIADAPWKVTKVLVQDSDSKINTGITVDSSNNATVTTSTNLMYGQWVENQGIVTVAYDANHVYLYNLYDSSVNVRIYYTVQV